MGPGCVKTLRGMTAPGILRLVVTLRAKKRKNSSSARRYDQIRFRFRTAWTLNRHGHPHSIVLAWHSDRISIPERLDDGVIIRPAPAALDPRRVPICR